jgi:protoporphyrinogen oxidase
MKGIIGKIDPNDKRVSIWGAGISGLLIAHYLKKSGFQVTVFDTSAHVGGKIQSKIVNGAVVEKAANALYLNADGLELLQELGLELLRPPEKLSRFIFREGKPRSPFSFGLLKTLFHLRKRPPQISDGLSVADFFQPLLGEEKIHSLLSPALSGIYATDATSLHFLSLFPEAQGTRTFPSYWAFFKHLKSKRQNHLFPERGSVGFRGGMHTLIEALAKNLDVRLNSKDRFNFRENNIICTEAFSAADLLQSYRADLSAELRRIRYLPVSTVNVFLKYEVPSLKKAFGVLIPSFENFKAIGILNNRAIFSENYPNTISYTLISPQESSDDEVLNDLKQLDPRVEFSDILNIERTDWQRGLPLYDLNRYLTVKKLHGLIESEQRLAFFGNYVQGISLREMITEAKVFSKSLG